MPVSSETLNEAFELIEKGDYAQARFLLKPLLAEAPDDEDLLWVYAHAAEDEKEGRDILLRLRALNPDYPGLHPLLTQVGLASATSVSSTPKSVPSSTSEKVAPSPAYETEDFELEEAVVATESASGGGRSCLYLILAGLLILVVTLVLLNASGVLAPAQVADEPTATIESETPAATVDTQTASSQTVDMESLAASLDVDLAEQGIELSETALGQTLVVFVCQLPGPNATDVIRSVFDTLAQQPPDALGGATHFGVGLTECGSNTVLRSVGASVEDAISFAQGETDAAAFEATWRPF